RVTGDLLRLDCNYFADPVGRIDDEITGGKGRLLGIHIRLSQSTHLALPGRFSWSLDWATVTAATRTRSAVRTVNRQQHHDDNTMKMCLMPAGGRISPPQIPSANPLCKSPLQISVRRDWG